MTNEFTQSQHLNPFHIDRHEPAQFIKYDWITAVIPIQDADVTIGLEDTVLQKLSALGLHGIELERLKNGLGKYHYADGWAMCDASIMIGARYNPDANSDDEDNEMMIQASGRGVEAIYNIIIQYGLDIDDYIEAVIAQNGTFSRLDIAVDLFNYDYHFSPYHCDIEAQKGNLVTRSRTVKTVHSYPSSGINWETDHASSEFEGFTFYVGKNPKQLRVYNKKAERLAKVDKLFNVESWYRWEFQLNGAHAEAFMSDVQYHGLPDTWKAWMQGYRFIERLDHNRSRCPNQTWFDALVNDLEYTHASTHKVISFERSKKWIDKQVSGTAKALFLLREQQYLDNGLEYEDAHKMAIKQWMHDMLDGTEDDDIDRARLMLFIKEAESQK